eukprot:COSAG04_NODE_17193_length_476_cov_0.933687_1_plen_65_part_10
MRAWGKGAHGGSHGRYGRAVFHAIVPLQPLRAADESEWKALKALFSHCHPPGCWQRAEAVLVCAQ